MKKRILSLLMALVLVTGLLPGTVLAGETATSVTVELYASSGDIGFLCTPGKLAVSAGTAAEYGFSYGSNVGPDDVTLLDVLVQAHVLTYGDRFASNPSDYLVSSDGWIRKAFRIESSNNVQLVNGGMLADDLGTGYTADDAVLSDGDVIEFIFGVAEYSNLDVYSYFSDTTTGTKLTSVVAGKGTALNLTLTGGYLYSMLYPERYGDFSAEGLNNEDECLSLYYVDEDNGLTDLIETTQIGGDGTFTLSVPDEAGTYILSAMGYESDHPITLPYLKLTATDSAPTGAEIGAAAVDNLTWDKIGGENLSPAALRTNFTLPESSYPGTVIEWSCADQDFDAFSIYGNTAYVTRPAAKTADRNYTLTATIKDSATSDTLAVKTFPVTVPAEGYRDENQQSVVDFKTVMDGIAACYSAGSDDAWAVLDMAAYGVDAANSSYNSDLTAVTEASGVNVIAKYALSEMARGNDGETLLSMLDSAGASSAFFSYIPFALSAYARGDADNENIEGCISALLSSALSTGGWNYGYGDAIDVDLTAMAIAGLAPYYSSNADVKTTINKALTALSAAQDSNGAWGSSNSTAMVITALSALGIDAHTDSRFIKNYKSAVEGLLYYAICMQDPNDYSGQTMIYGFGYKGNVTKNALATEQGFRALVSYARFKETGAAYNIYLDADVSASVPADPGITATTPPAPILPSGNITVYFTLTGDSVHGEDAHTAYETWISRHSVTVTSGSTVGDVFTAELSNAGYTAVGAEIGYVTSITTPEGVTLSQLDNGADSGWMYRVNGVLPSVGLNDYILSNGDEIVWFYVDDWHKVHSNSESSETNQPSAPVLKDIDLHWAADAIETVCRLGLMEATDGSSFAPEQESARNTLITALYRLSGTTEDNPLQWAVDNGVLAGYGDGVYGTDDPMTREQMMVFLYRYACLTGRNVDRKADLCDYGDCGTISEWAIDAMAWAVGEGLICGTSASTLSPGETATRAQTAVILARWLESA